MFVLKLRFYICFKIQQLFHHIKSQLKFVLVDLPCIPLYMHTYIDMQKQPKKEEAMNLKES